jgi:PTH1 family peptidyl-tRNA hydrolase
MALLQKKPQLSSNLPLYTTGLGDNRFLVVGLGNPDKKYDRTRHNVGFDCVDAFASEHDFPSWSHKSNQRSDIATQQLANNQIILSKPTTYMNKSGDAVASIAQFYKISPSSIIVIYDDKDIRFGQIRTQLGGSSAGHNGIKSIIGAIGAEFGRVRIGIGTEELMEDASKFVLSRFNKEEMATLPNIKRETTAILTEYIFSGAPLLRETRNIL